MAKTLSMQATPLSDEYFSLRNVSRVQASLGAEVKRRTGFSIAPQSADELLIIMRAIYADHAEHRPRGPLSNEVQRLNGIVLSRIVDSVIANMTAHLAYLRDASRPREPIPLGVTTSTKGLKSGTSLFRGV